MSSIVNKVKEALHHDKNEGTKEGEHGPHSSKVANAADPRIDSDRDHRAAPGHHTTAGTTAGHSTTGHTTTGAGTFGSGPAQNTAGPHNSDMLNKADPRVDSDRDGSRRVGNTGAGTFGSGPAQNTAGPHNSDMLNKVDPRVDSDLDGSRRVGNTGPGGLSGTTATTGHQGIGGQGIGHQGVGHQGIGGQHSHATTGTGALGGAGSSGFGTTTGAHTGTHTGTHAGTGVTGFNDPTGTHGPHSNRAMNAADPRVDSDRDHRGAAATSAFGTGPAQNTAGPHKSDMLNKADPRVDSDLDGSKTVGGNQTFQS